MSLFFCSVFSGAFSAEASFFHSQLSAGRSGQGYDIIFEFHI
jgi:hypothetical protein